MIDKIKSLINKEDINCSFYIEDLKTGEAFKYNEACVVPSASLIKIFIMGTVFNMVEKKSLDLDSRLSICNDDIVPGGIIELLSIDNTYTLLDLVTLMIVESDNTATNKIIDYIGISNINEFMEKQGCEDTILQRKMMDFKAKEAGMDNFTTSENLRRFLINLYDGYSTDNQQCRQMIDIMRNQRDSRMLRRELEDDIIVAHKTGDLPGLNHDAGIILGNKDYIFVMLTWNAEDNLTGKKLIGEASKLVYEEFKK